MGSNQEFARDYRRWKARRKKSHEAAWNRNAFDAFATKLFHLLRRLTIFFLTWLFRPYRRDRHPSIDSTKKLLVIPGAPAGDLLLCTPLWRSAKLHNPEVVIGVGASPRNINLLAADDSISAIYKIVDYPLRTQIAELLRARRDGWDVILVPAGCFKPTRWAFMSRVIGGARGYTATLHRSRAKRYGRIYSYCGWMPWEPEPQPMVRQFAALYEGVFGVAVDQRAAAPTVPILEAAQRSVSERLEELRASRGRETIVHVNLEAKTGRLEWGLENSLKLATCLEAKYPDVQVILTCSPNYMAELREHGTLTPDLSARFVSTRDLQELAALVAQVQLVISPDTAVVHLAAMANTPQVAIFDVDSQWFPHSAVAQTIVAGEGNDLVTVPMNSVLSAVESQLSGALTNSSNEDSRRLSDLR